MPILIFLFILLCCVPSEAWSDIFAFFLVIAILVLALLVSWLVLYTLYLSGPIGWLIGVGAIFLIAYLISIGNKKREEELEKKKRELVKERKKLADAKAKVQKNLTEKINEVKRSIVVFVRNSNTYAIPIFVSRTDVILLQPTIINSSYQPSIKFLEIKSSIGEIDLISGIPKDSEFHVIAEISSVAKDLYLNIDPQNKDLKSKLTELKRLEKLARFSELYKQQADLYSRASSQIQELLDIGENLSRECHTFILDILIGQELVRYNVDELPDVLEIRLRLDDRCKMVSDRYQLLKSEMEEYMNLKNGL